MSIAKMTKSIGFIASIPRSSFRTTQAHPAADFRIASSFVAKRRKRPFVLQGPLEVPRNCSATMVFTGIVEEMGHVQSLENIDSEEGGVNMVVSAETTLQGVQLGDSISVNGTCLTVTNLESNTFTFGLAPETLRRTNLGDLHPGSRVNLERSLAADGRFGGHVVQGHVDCTGRIADIRREKDAIWYTIALPSEYMKYIVEKGYVAVDGTSLTVCDVLDKEASFTFMMIPYTQAHVVTALKKAGDKVNIEVDITGKYIERIIAARTVSV